MVFKRSHPGERHYRGKLALRWIALIITCIAIVLSVLGRTVTWLLFIPLPISFIWNIANIARRLSARSPIHPGANVAVDLIIWLAFLGTLVLTWPASLYYFYWKAPETMCTQTDGTGNCISFDGFLNEVIFENDRRIASILATTAAALSTVDLMLHFTLFMIACIDTHRRRHADRYPEYRQDYEKVNELKDLPKDLPQQQTAYEPTVPFIENQYGQSGI